MLRVRGTFGKARSFEGGLQTRRRAASDDNIGAARMISLISPSGSPNIDGLLYPYKWSAPTLTYGFPQKASVYGVSETDFEPLTDIQKN